ncbi:hypothetical protein [Nostoc sp.]
MSLMRYAVANTSYVVLAEIKPDFYSWIFINIYKSDRYSSTQP